ncbi:STAS/SEC14 domain-containing protein [Pseudomonas sp. JS3066]|uniref:STAS/SEC14 domain-containing protein n=1 Tax=Pseudomonas sp. JS3066 TaxID=3090665 RepID=UPI002E7B244B|nr:STAS/SEC14 domain-containing protein [Pseudomonas sp. JS3066]WVK91127.1 STAS/SEC14 domain-containing protein [Pseudomonas sp. JS3066]
MFQVMRNGENRVDVELAGKLDSDDMRAAINQLSQQSEGIAHGRMLYRIGKFDMPTLGAMAVEVSHIPQLFKVVRRFDRMAVVADTGWVRKVSEVEGALIPGLTIKAFGSQQAAEAEAWLQR